MSQSVEKNSEGTRIAEVLKRYFMRVTVTEILRVL
jgi:hypothetical protein